MTENTKYPKELRVQVTEEMHQFATLLAQRHRTSLSDVVRQAMREYLDTQEDIITSRSRLGRTVLRRLDTMQHHFLNDYLHATSILLAGIILLDTRRGGVKGSDVLQEITRLAKHARQELRRALKSEG
jgi:Arc/MetJ-type ribon-helix-helix transcriptional regulator